MRELAVMVTLFVVYRQIRYLTRDDTGAARANAGRIVDFERRLGVFSERALQDAVMHSETVITLLNRYYVTVHFPLTAVFVMWVMLRHQAWYPSIRTWFVTVTTSALAIHVAFPLAPPRMLVGEGFVDTLDEFGPNIYSSDTQQSMANQFAAMPSLHFGWALMVAVGFVAIKRSRRSLVAFAHPLITLVAIVATANHYWLDAAVAFVVVATFSVAIVTLTPTAQPNRTENPDPETVNTPEINNSEEHDNAHHHHHHHRRPAHHPIDLVEPAVASGRRRRTGDQPGADRDDPGRERRPRRGDARRPRCDPGDRRGDRCP